MFRGNSLTETQHCSNEPHRISSRTPTQRIALLRPLMLTMLRIMAPGTPLLQGAHVGMRHKEADPATALRPKAAHININSMKLPLHTMPTGQLSGRHVTWLLKAQSLRPEASCIAARSRQKLTKQLRQPLLRLNLMKVSSPVLWEVIPTTLPRTRLTQHQKCRLSISYHSPHGITMLGSPEVPSGDQVCRDT